MNTEERIAWLYERTNMPGTFTATNGMRITHIGPDCVKGELDAGTGHSNPIGIVHGGVFATMMDQVAGSAATLVSVNGAVKTMDCSVRYFKPGILGTKLYSQAEVLKAGRTVIVVEAWVENEEKKHLAEGTFTFCAD